MSTIFNTQKGDICHIRNFEYVLKYIQDYEYEKAIHSRYF
jgi:hypothetical protein